MSGRLAGKRALVTGAATGIGKGIALEFAKQGADVALHYSHESAEPVVRDIAAAGGKAKAFQADFRDLAEVKRLATEATDFLGGMDILVNNSGITFNTRFEDVTPEIFDALYAVNVRGGYFLTQYALPHLLETGDAAVIHLASVHGYAGMTEHTVYAGTKGAIVAETRVMALELGQRGIRVNAIAPGWIFVESHRAQMGDDFDVDEEGKACPAGFLGTANDIANLAVFLACKESRYILGQTFVCDGGQLSIMPLTGDFRDVRPERWGRDYVQPTT